MRVFWNRLVSWIYCPDHASIFLSFYTFSWSSLNKRPRRSARAFFRICPNSIILFCLSETSLWYSVWKRHSKKKKSLILQVGNIHTAGRVYLLGICRLQGIYLSRKKENMAILNTDYQSEMERNCRRSETCQLFLFLKICCTVFISFVSIYSFFQANFTFGFVENLKTYSETWLRMSEVFKTSGNVLKISQLQVGEPWEGFLFCNYLLCDLDRISRHIKLPIYPPEL